VQDDIKIILSGLAFWQKASYFPVFCDWIFKIT